MFIAFCRVTYTKYEVDEKTRPPKNPKRPSNKGYRLLLDIPMLHTPKNINLHAYIQKVKER